MNRLAAAAVTRYPIGNYLGRREYNRITNAAIGKLGIIDLHSHFRLRPLLNFFRGQLGDERQSVLELGCGNGVNLFELSRMRPISAIGYDMDAAAIAQAREISEVYFDSAITFRCDDIADVAEQSSFDYVLCMDILEHVEKPRELLLKADRLVKHGAYLVISVPTERYPLVFGRRFHQSIGHVMDGYNARLLNDTVPPSYKLVTARYSTGLLASLGCALYYRGALAVPNHYIRVAMCILLVSLFKWLDVLNGERLSCSLFAVYRKP